MLRLEDIPMFSTLTQSSLKELYNHTLIKNYAKDSIVFYEGDESSSLHILLEGSVKMYKTTPKGTQVQINRLGAPDLIAEFACFEKQPFPASCEFVTKGTMGLLPFEVIFKHLADPVFSLEIIKSLTGKVSLLTALVHQETVLSSEAKVADLMLQRLSLFHRLKNNELASILNLTPETFSRILTKLKKEGVITVEDQKIVILNEDALYTIVDTNTIKDCTNCIASFKDSIGYKG